MRAILLIASTLLSLSALADDDFIAVGVVDSGYRDLIGVPPVKLCKFGHADFSNEKPQFKVPNDEDGHGTMMAHIINDSLLLSGVRSFCLVIIKPKFGPETDLTVEKSFQKSMGHLLRLPSVKVVNLSMSGTKKISGEGNLIKALLNKGIKIFAAAGNDGINLDEKPTYPGNYDSRITVVGSKCVKMHSNFTSNYGSSVTQLEECCYSRKPFYACGTSDSTAIATYKWVLNKLLSVEGYRQNVD